MQIQNKNPTAVQYQWLTENQQRTYSLYKMRVRLILMIKTSQIMIFLKQVALLLTQLSGMYKVSLILREIVPFNR